jgi:hypothetical protein
MGAATRSTIRSCWPTGKRDDKLDGGFVVVRKLGRGGTADALVVRRDGEDDELVLKIAVDEAHGGRLQAEAAVLRRLHHRTSSASSRR